jgi:hypothetical protein
LALTEPNTAMFLSTTSVASLVAVLHADQGCQHWPGE